MGVTELVHTVCKKLKALGFLPVA